MKNKLNAEEQLFRDKLNRAEADFNYQESDWQEIQQKLPKNGALGKYSTLIKAGIGFAVIVAIAYLANTNWSDSEVDHFNVVEKFTEINPSLNKAEKAPKDLDVKIEDPSNQTSNQTSNTNVKKDNSIKAGELNEKAIKQIDKGTVQQIEEQEEGKTDLSKEKKEIPSDNIQSESSTPIVLNRINIEGKVCVGSTIKLTPEISGANLDKLHYNWLINGVKQRSNKSTLDYHIKQSGLLKIELSALSENKIESTLSKELEAPKTVDIDFTYLDMESPYDDFSAIFSATPEGLENIKWDIKEMNSSLEGNHAKYNFGKKGVFDVMLIYTNKNGCSVEISKPVFINQNFETLAPNAFTPDGNDLNEAFIPIGFTPEAGIVKNDEFRMSIYDFNGRLVYSTRSNREPWNGRLNNSGNVLLEGVYVWKVELKNSNGKEASYAGKFKLMH